MYTVGVRDHIMIAHSFRGEVFGPAQKLHGATYVIDVELRRPTVDADGIVIDIGRARDALRATLAALDYKNLDEDPALAGQNTTTENLARVVFDRLARAAAAGELGPGGPHLRSMKVTLRESHVAWASYEAELPSTGG